MISFSLKPFVSVTGEKISEIYSSLSDSFISFQALSSLSQILASSGLEPGIG